MDRKQLFEKRIQSAPRDPGCYIWKDKDYNVLYVGKAVNLKNRLSSYILNYDRLDPKIRAMVDLVDNVDYYTVDSEVEALILETNLIKKYRPKYNKLMKDDKNYSWIVIDWNKDYPMIKIVRDNDMVAKDRAKVELYGPYPQSFPAKKVLTRLRKIFPYCERLPKGINKGKFEDKPCFDTHIGLCSGVCANLVTKNQHRQNINGIRKFLKGDKFKIVEEMKKEMVDYSKQMKFEDAAALRDGVKDLEYVTQRIRIERDMDEAKLMLEKENIRKRGLHELLLKIGLIENTEVKIKEDFKIECYDISNFQGTNAVGSMVVFTGGKSAKNLYRKFKIKTKSTPDDFWMMREVLTRRLRHLVLPEADSPKAAKEDSPEASKDESLGVVPDLIIVDGGKGQLSSAHSILKSFKLLEKIPLIGLAKREEEIFKVIGEINDKNLEFKRIFLPRKSDGLYLIQRIRDEAHRFAIGYHRLLRSKGQTKSQLDDIPGVGVIVKKRLLEAFGNVESIKKASLADLSTVVRSKKTVEAIRKLL